MATSTASAVLKLVQEAGNKPPESGHVRPSVRVDAARNRRFLDGDSKLVYGQYSNLYHARMHLLKPRLTQQIRRLDGDATKPIDIEDLEDDRCAWIIGNVFKIMPMKPSIVKELLQDKSLDVQPIQERYYSDSDTLTLQGPHQKIPLAPAGPVSSQSFPCGTTIAVFGKRNSDGVFFVERHIVPGTPVSAVDARPMLGQLADKHVLFFSGLGLDRNANTFAAFNHFIACLTGLVAVGGETKDILDSTAAVIVAGNLVTSDDLDREKLRKTATYITKTTEPRSALSIDLTDKVLLSLLDAVPVILMPGPNDPARWLMPQLPFSAALLAKSHSRANLHRATNPYNAELDGVELLGTSGINILDILRNVPDTKTPLDAMRRTLEWGHMAPTAPNTLPAVSLSGTDPFVFERAPDIYFAGNQPNYEADLLEFVDPLDEARCKRTLLVAIPQFCKSFSCVAVNLSNLHSTELTFKTGITENGSGDAEKE